MAFLNEELRGVFAAVASPFCMALGFIVWDKTWKGSSAFSLNLFKCNFASIIFVASGFIFGFVLQQDLFSWEHIGWLFLSGFLGIIVGDWLWLEALQRLGAFQVLVIDTVKPFCAALMGHLLLDEREIHPFSYIAMLLTVIGVLVVSMEQNRIASVTDENTEDSGNDTLKEKENETTEGMEKAIADVSNDGSRNGDDSLASHDEESGSINNTGTDKVRDAVVEENQTTSSFRKVGYILAVANVLLDTYGSLLTKQHGWNFTTWGINLIRFGSSGVLMAIVSASLSIYYRWKKSQGEENNEDAANDIDKKEEWYQLPSKTPRIWTQICFGVVFVTYLCPALSNYALFKIPLAYALTLTSITPLYAIFLEWYFFGEDKRPTLRAVAGSSMAVGGVVWLGILNALANER